MSENPYAVPGPPSTAVLLRDAAIQRARLLQVFIMAGAFVLLVLCWPPFFLVGRFVMVTTPVPLWMRAEVALFGHAYIVEPHWVFFAVLCAEIMAAGLWLDWRRRTRSARTPRDEGIQ